MSRIRHGVAVVRPAGGTRVRIAGITKRFGATVAVDDVSLTLEPGEFLTLLGPSGCGKTTTLRVVAGLEVPSAGRVWIGDEDVTDLPAHARDVTMVFQSYALFPHLTVFENVAYGLRVLRRSEPDVRHAVEEVLALTGMEALPSRYPAALSGGQQQRVALARALVLQPKVLLFDEPLSNLDAKLRRRMRDEIRSLQKRTGITALYVTHDQAEALAISDRIAVMARGRIEQLGPAMDLYARPASRFVADFIGEANFLPVEVVARDATGAHVRLGPITLTVTDGHRGLGPATLVVRPEAILIRAAPSGAIADGVLPGRIRSAAYLGAAGEYAVDTEIGSVNVTDPAMAEGLLPSTTDVWLTLRPRGLALLPPGPPLEGAGP
ncbi:MAG: ABC transporter ATP-binding protein [Candidatus Rokuibacteriota bacterium]|nr:MAG: ABC transporter ATP-binding protein [Candidatus Rokubacteria bacterium]